MEPIISVVIAAIALAVGAGITWILFSTVLKQKRNQAFQEAKKIIEEAKRTAETIKKDKIVEAKERFLELQTEFEHKTETRKKELLNWENRIRQKETELTKVREQLGRKEQELVSLKETLHRQLEVINAKKADLEKLHQQHIAKFENIAQLTVQEAKAQLIESLKEEARTEAISYTKSIIDEAKLKANKEAKKIILQTIQRVAAEQTVENAISVFHLESDDIKGQIIGREGRNIRALEAATGVEIIVDDTPEAVVISGFDPIRREIARIALQRLVADGRIHPARIEEVVAKTKKEIEDHIVEIGERTIIDLGIHGLHPELVKLVGKMRFRSSYGQNLLQHSRETANLCAIMAAELGLNPKLAKRAGLLHDIGKVSEENPELSHAILGMKLAEKYGEHVAVVNAIGAHHDEIEMTYAISPIVQACDAISGSRPGARRETSEMYMQRLRDLEAIAMSYSGVEKAYAMLAGRELRVIVESDKVSDKEAEELSFKIAKRIEEEMQYPGQIKVTVIREKRAIAVAK